MKVAFRKEACDDLDHIHAWISKDNPVAAAQVIDRILDSAENLGRFPLLGRRGTVPGTRELAVKGLPYIIVYEHVPTRGDVVVIAAFHGAQYR